MTVLWGITGGEGGVASQVQGVLSALGLPYLLKSSQRREPFVWLPMAFYDGAFRQLTPKSDPLEAPWPAAVVTSGRRSAPLGLAIKAASGGVTKAIHLTDPRACRLQFDLIVAMEHDRTPGPNVVRTHFALHRVTKQTLAEAGPQWEAKFARLPRPWIAVLLGGSTNRYTLTDTAMRQLVDRLQETLQSTPGSLLITPSRRTGEANVALLRETFASDPRVFLHDMKGDNPYMGMLALADHIVVTDDSVNMISEACFTGKPVHILAMAGQQETRPKPLQFARRMVEEGIARPLSLPLETWRYPVVDEMQRVTDAIRRLLGF